VKNEKGIKKNSLTRFGILY